MRAAQQSIETRQPLRIGAQFALLRTAVIDRLAIRRPCGQLVEQQRIVRYPLQRIPCAQRIGCCRLNA